MEQTKLISIKGVIIILVIVSVSIGFFIIINSQLTEDKVIQQDYLVYYGVNITWYGSASFKLKTDNLTIYIDPYEITLDQVEKADILIITHHHYDHLSLNDILNISDPLNTEIYYPEWCTTYLINLNSSYKHNIVSSYDNITIKGITLNFIPSYTIYSGSHMKDLGLIGVNIDFGAVRIFHPGDSDDIPEFRSVVTDIALIPIYNMEAALDIVLSLEKVSKLKYAIPMHYNSMENALEFVKKTTCKTIILTSL